MIINNMLPAILQREIARSLNNSSQHAPGFSHHLRSEIIEREHGWDLLIELPGMDREDVEVQLELDELVVKGARNREALSEQDRVLHSSRLFGTFEKRFRLADEIDRSGIEASMDKGVLKLQLKKAAQALPTKVEIR